MPSSIASEDWSLTLPRICAPRHISSACSPGARSAARTGSSWERSPSFAIASAVCRSTMRARMGFVLSVGRWSASRNTGTALGLPSSPSTKIAMPRIVRSWAPAMPARGDWSGCWPRRCNAKIAPARTARLPSCRSGLIAGANSRRRARPTAMHAEKRTAGLGSASNAPTCFVSVSGSSTSASTALARNWGYSAAHAEVRITRAASRTLPPSGAVKAGCAACTVPGMVGSGVTLSDRELHAPVDAEDCSAPVLHPARAIRATAIMRPTQRTRLLMASTHIRTRLIAGRISPSTMTSVGRPSSDGVARSVPARRGASRSTTLPQESIHDDSPVFATRTIGSLHSMHRQRAIISWCRRPASLLPNQPSLERFTMHDAGSGSCTMRRTTCDTVSSKQMGVAIRRSVPGQAMFLGRSPASMSKLMPAAPSARSRSSSQSQALMYGMRSPNGVR